MLVLMPRFKLQFPPPSQPYNSEVPLAHPQLGAPLPPIPHLMVHQKPICAATVRLGPGWLEVPFYATQETRRNRGERRAHPPLAPLCIAVVINALGDVM